MGPSDGWNEKEIQRSPEGGQFDIGTWLLRNLTEKKIAILIIGLFLIMSIMIAMVPYDPQTDLADAVTNDIWVEYYSQGKFIIPYDEWSYGITQSVVVWHDGQFQVVNEKGPGHALLLVPFYLLGADFLFGPLMAGIAVLATYMLGKRLFNWRIGAMAAVFVLTDVSVIMMWYRSYWNDASTMSLLVLAIWLAVEANYWINGRSLDTNDVRKATIRQKLTAIIVGMLAGLSFGMAVSTRYATALILIPIVLYFVGFYLIRAWPSLRACKMSAAIRSTFRMWPLMVVFMIGLACVLLPLMSYNSMYFGGLLSSGYDATTLEEFSEFGNLTERTTSSDWDASSFDGLSTAASNFITLLPTLIARMPFLLLFPFGLWMVRKKYPIMALLAGWTAVNFYTYLSISWVSIYAGGILSGVLYEPRYFIPSIPALALMAGIAIDGFMCQRERNTDENGHSTGDVAPDRLVLSVILVLAIILCSLVPAAVFFAEPQQMIEGGLPQDQGHMPDGLPPGGAPIGGPDDLTVGLSEIEGASTMVEEIFEISGYG
ncbi:MAG: hypothetical protein MIO90_07565 [Methanomassiliicoccales archaeon]|nr:hypothetical protein [Methanomassiliicoccales archaeon]